MPDVGSGFVLLRLLRAALFALGGVPFTLRSKRLIAWSIVPMFVQLALLGGILWGASSLLELHGAWGWLALAALSIPAVVVSLMVGSVVCDPFYDVLSEATESVMLGRDLRKRRTLGNIVVGIWRELVALPWRLVMYLLIAGPLWLLSLTGVGAVVAIPLTLAWTWVFVALSGMSRSLSRHSMRRGRRFSLIFSRPMVALGFGAAGWALSHLPFTYPFLIVGGTRLHLALAAWDHIPSNLTEADKLALRGRPPPTAARS